MPSFSQILLVSLAIFSTSSNGLSVLPKSSCTSVCQESSELKASSPDVQATNSSDIVCRDQTFSNRKNGIRMKACLECLEKNDEVDGSESNLNWYLYNMRYTLSSCIFSVPNAIDQKENSSPCSINYACEPLKGAFTKNDLEPQSNDTYGYCVADGGSSIGDAYSQCLDCLRSSDDQAYLANFVTALEAGCQQQPDPGKTVSLSGSVFTKGAVNITEPPVDIRSKPEGAGSGTLTTGAIVGIAIAAGLFLFGGIALFIIHWRRQRSFSRGEKIDTRNGDGGSPDPLFSPETAKMSAPLRQYRSQQPYRHKKGSMSVAEYYGQMESDMYRDKTTPYHVNVRPMPQETSEARNLAHPAYIPRVSSRRTGTPESRESYHPGVPQAVHRRSQSHPQEMYAIPSYIPGQTIPAVPTLPAETRAPSQLQTQAPPAHVAVPGAESIPNAIPPPPPPSRQLKVPSLLVPTAAKLRMPKQYEPPSLVVHPASPVGNWPLGASGAST